jgi:hypothetical protein
MSPIDQMQQSRVGIDEEEVGEQLETEGVDRFAASYQAIRASG